MKKALIYSLSILLSSVLFSCRQVVDWELPDSEPAIVVQSEISNVEQYWTVNLSMTQSYFSNQDPPTIIDAEVSITDDMGNRDTLFHSGNGLYETRDLKTCEVGRKYTLNIKHAGKEYFATEELRSQLPFDTVGAIYNPGIEGFAEPGYYLVEIAQESEEIGDFYQWRVYRNDTLLDDFYIIDTDEFADFSYFNQNFDIDRASLDYLPRPFPYLMEIGDSVRLEQLCISKNYFDFLFEIEAQRSKEGSPFDAPPSNPISNISNGAFGYFSVVNEISKEFVVVE
jgi:hypothetical protein